MAVWGSRSWLLLLLCVALTLTLLSLSAPSDCHMLLLSCPWLAHIVISSPWGPWSCRSGTGCDIQWTGVSRCLERGQDTVVRTLGDSRAAGFAA